MPATNAYSFIFSSNSTVKDLIISECKCGSWTIRKLLKLQTGAIVVLVIVAARVEIPTNNEIVTKYRAAMQNGRFIFISERQSAVLCVPFLFNTKRTVDSYLHKFKHFQHASIHTRKKKKCKKVRRTACKKNDHHGLAGRIGLRIHEKKVTQIQHINKLWSLSYHASWMCCMQFQF